MTRTTSFLILFISLTACSTSPVDEGPRYWPCKSWEIPVEWTTGPHAGMTTCEGGDAVRPPGDVSAHPISREN